MSSDNLVALITNTALKLGEYFDDEQLAKATSREQLHQ